MVFVSFATATYAVFCLSFFTNIVFVRMGNVADPSGNYDLSGHRKSQRIMKNRWLITQSEPDRPAKRHGLKSTSPRAELPQIRMVLNQNGANLSALSLS